MFVNFIVKPFLAIKESHSRWLSNQWSKYKVPLPAIKDHQELIEWMNINFKYIADPLNGIYDTYTHPEIAWYCSKNNAWGTVTYDCDDYACMAYAMLLKMPGYEPKIMNLIINPWKVNDYAYNHVVCYFTTPTGSHKVIDTHPFIHDIDARNGVEKGVLDRFSNLYAKDYKYVVPVRYPFY